MSERFPEIPSFREMILHKGDMTDCLAIEKSAKWKEFGEEGRKARDRGNPLTYLVVHADPKTEGGYDPAKFNPPEHLITSAVGKPRGVLYASRYYPDKNGGHASDWDRFTGSSIPSSRNSRGYTFQLTPEARIKTINTDDEYVDFYSKYGNVDEGEIDWNAVKKDHDVVRFGDFFSRTSGNRAHVDSNPDIPVPYLSAGQILVFNPSVVTNAKDWRRNEDLHPGDWYDDWIRNDPTNLQEEKEYREKNNMIHNNDYRGPEQPTAESDGLDEGRGYHNDPSVARFFSEQDD